MITGYNTDVRHGNRIFHVQTEDKGLANPKIETLIYVGGEILDSFRGSYDDLMAVVPVQESAIQARMDDQHKSVIRDIKNGKYDPTPNDPQLAERSVFNDKPLDQAILEYLQAEGDTDTLELVLDEPMNPRFGCAFQVRVRTRLCVSQNPLAGTDVAVRLISNLKKASLLASGRTDGEGTFMATVELPPSQPGHCAVLIACTSEFGNDEVRALITT